MLPNVLSWVSVILTVVVSTSHGNPAFQNKETAPYTVTRKTQKYEIRTYPKTKWVCFDYIGPEFSKRQMANSFLTLFDYHQGENIGGLEMSMAAPTTVRIVMNVDNEGNNLFQMCMYLCQSHQEAPPEPLEEGVFIQNRPKMIVAVRQFEAFNKRGNKIPWEEHRQALQKDLMDAQEPNMNYEDFYGAAFDDPYMPNARQNEVWVVKKN